MASETVDWWARGIGVAAFALAAATFLRQLWRDHRQKPRLELSALVLPEETTIRTPRGSYFAHVEFTLYNRGRTDVVIAGVKTAVLTDGVEFEAYPVTPLPQSDGIRGHDRYTWFHWLQAYAGTKMRVDFETTVTPVTGPEVSCRFTLTTRATAPRR